MRGRPVLHLLVHAKRGAVILTALLGCQEPTADPSTTSARPSASIAPPPASAASAAASDASTWPGSLSLKQLLAGASLVKVSQIAHEGSRVDMRAGVLTEPKDLESLLLALGQDQTPAPGCVRCMPSVTLTFEDGRGTRLAAVGLFCDEGSAATQATLRDGAGNNCHLLKLADVTTARALIKKGAATAASGAASASAAPSPSATGAASAKPSR